MRWGGGGGAEGDGGGRRGTEGRGWTLLCYWSTSVPKENPQLCSKYGTMFSFNQIRNIFPWRFCHSLKVFLL